MEDYMWSGQESRGGLENWLPDNMTNWHPKWHNTLEKIASQIVWALMRIMQTCQIISGPAQTEADKEASRPIAQKIHSKFIDVFTGTGCFEGTFKLQVWE